MKKNLYVIVLFALVLSTSGCINEGLVKTNTLSIKASSSELKIEPSSSKVDSFLSKNQNFNSNYETDTCFNITPDFIANNSGFTIFKYSLSSASFLLFDDEIYSLGLFGGLTSVALGDLDKDNQYELYFTSSWGSGIHRSQIGYFNPSTKKVTVFDFQYFDHDMILTTNEAETSLSVNEAATEYNSLVDFTVKSNSNKLIATIVSEKNNILLRSTISH